MSAADTNARREHLIRIASNYTQLGASFVIGLIIVRLLLLLGEEVFGTLAVLTAAAGLARLLRDVLQTGLVPVLGKAWHSTEGADSDETFRRVFTAAVSTAALAAVAGLLPFLLIERLLDRFTIPPDMRHAAAIFIGLRALQTTVATVASPWLTMILVRQKMVLHNTLIIAERVLELGAALVTLFLVGTDDPSRAVITFALIICIGSILIYFTIVVITVSRSRHLRPQRTSLRQQRRDITNITESLGWNALHTISMNLHLRLDVIIMNSVFGLAAGMLFSLASQATSYLRQLTMGLVGGIDALAARHQQQHNRTTAPSTSRPPSSDLQKLNRRQSQLQAFVVFPAAAALFIAAEPLLSLWLRDRLDNPAASIPQLALYCRLLIAGIVARSLSESWIAILTGSGQARRFAPVVLAGALANPLLIIVALATFADDQRHLGPALSFSSIFVIVHLVLIPRITARTLGVSLRSLFQPIFPAIAATLLSATAIAPLIKTAAPIPLLILFGIAYMLTSAALWGFQQTRKSSSPRGSGTS